ncbi:MAG: (Fe-S)-binding protein, partial [Desulfovibrio sp.]|nr:(Fe-S)-binding protein [Desulfovibrio sp.]
PGMRKGSALCCGLGGVLQIMNPELSRDLAAKCWDGLGARAEVLTGCSGCTLQLASHAPEGACVRHWLDVVDV